MKPRMTPGIVGQESEHRAVAFFDLQQGLKLFFGCSDSNGPD